MLDKMFPMNIEKSQWTKRFDFSMLSAWLLLSLTLATISFLLFGVDFRGYYAAARVLLAGGNPYDYQQVAQVLLDVTGEMGNNPYYYPPWFAWLFIPLAYLPFQIARAIWMVFNVVIWNISLWQLGKIIGWPLIGWRRYLLFTLTTFSFAWITWRYEQAGILVFILLVALILSIRNQNWIWSGVWLALLLIKPNVTLIVVAGVGLWLLRRGQWRPVIAAALTLIVLVFIATLITPDWYQPFFEEGFGQGLTVALDGPNQVVAIRINTTFPDWLRTFGMESQLRTLFYGIAICAGAIVFVWTVYRSKTLLELVSVLLLVSYAITPYALQYDFPPLVIALFWALSRCAASPKTIGTGLILAGFVFSVIFWQQNISWAYWMVIGLLALTIWGLHQKAPQPVDNKKTASR
jgi:hypothetical protein